MSIGVILLTESPVSILAKSCDSPTKYLNTYENNICKYVFYSVLCIYCSDSCEWDHGTCFKPKP